MARNSPAPSDTDTLGPADALLEVFARLERRSHSAGVAWRLIVSGVAGPVRSATLRRSQSLLAAELVAVRNGLRQASRERSRTLTVWVPDPRLVGVLRGETRRTFRRARAAASRLVADLQPFESVRWESPPTSEPELVHAADEALDAGLHAVAAREEHRVWVMERIIERARSVELVHLEDGWVANGRYRVQLDPMRCECPAWTARWARAPIGGRRAERLPCKHLVALALREGITVPADLARLARSAPD